MAKFFAQLRAASNASEVKPNTKGTIATWTESPFLIRGKDESVPAWHYILVPSDKLAFIKSHTKGALINIAQFGRSIEYRDQRDRPQDMSGWGSNPPNQLRKWIEKHYGSAAVDQNTASPYVEDDIRLCTMQRSTPDQMLGIYQSYHRVNRFHYIQLFENFESTLAYRGGIRNFDRFIELNGVNIEQHTPEQLTERWDAQVHLPFQMLVCSPATYEHYKSNNKSLHSDLPTVQRLKPVYDTPVALENTQPPATDPADEDFCVVQWENSSIVCVVSQAAVFKAPEFTRVNDVCFVEVEEQYRKGQIIFKGSQEDCEIKKTDSVQQSPTVNSTDRNDMVFKHVQCDGCRSLINNRNGYKCLHCKNYTLCVECFAKRWESKLHSTNHVFVHLINPDRPTRFEHLPNELLLELFDYFDSHNLYRSFWELNSRLNTLVRSLQNLSLVFDEPDDLTQLSLYAPHIGRLAIDTSNHCDLSQFSNMHSLILHNRSPSHVAQIRPELLPNLVRLSLALESDFRPPMELVQAVFSNRFPSLRHVDLGRIEKPSTDSWSVSPRLQFVSIRCDEPMIVSCLLPSCPNLHHLQLHLTENDHNIVAPSSPSDHPLRRFTLWSGVWELTFDVVDVLLAYTPNVERMYLQTQCRVPFVQLVETVADRLHQLSRLDCFVKELAHSDTRTGDINTVHQIHPCFNPIQCVVERENLRIFATK